MMFAPQRDGAASSTAGVDPDALRICLSAHQQSTSRPPPLRSREASPREQLEGQLKSTLSEVKFISEQGLKWTLLDEHNPWHLAAQIEELDGKDGGGGGGGGGEEKEGEGDAAQETRQCKRQRMMDDSVTRTPTGCAQELVAKGGMRGGMGVGFR